MSDKIPAGDYELVSLMWDEVTSKPGQPFTFVRHRQGEIVTLNEEDARRLVLGGAVVEPGTREKAAAEAAKAVYLAALAALPADVRASIEGQQAAGGPVDGGSEGTPAGSGSAEGAAAGAEDEGLEGASLPEHLRELKVDDLKTYAATNGIELKGLTKKSEIQKAIVEAEA